VRPGAHLSLEDPVEQRLRLAGVPVDQVELDPSRGLTGPSMLAAALRQDVDVLAVGEVRSAAEAALAIQAAHTGRLVLAGVHAGSCEEARQRLIDLEADPKLLAGTLKAVLHQALVTVPCPCGGLAGCVACRGLGRMRKLTARLARVTAGARLEVAA
jgi:type II secretory ATPase GspE/PulE/Tfp pilus assembly ATPase PilB-like protein